MSANLRKRRTQPDRDSTLTESLLTAEVDDYEPPPFTAPPSASRSLILHQPFSLESFLLYIAQRWYALIRTFLQHWQREPAVELSLQQVQRLDELRNRIASPFDSDDVKHQAALRKLWALAFPDVPCGQLKSPQWKEMGWQGEDPGTDFRGAGYFGLENLIYLGTRHPSLFDRLLHKRTGQRADWEYPFAVAGLNITYMLSELLDLKDTSRLPKSKAGRGFLPLLRMTDVAFEELYCMTFILLDRTWLEAGASYMQFNQIIGQVRVGVERALAAHPEDLGALHMLLNPPRDP